MRVATKLALIGTGYVLAVAGGCAAVAVNDLLIPDQVQQTSGGMVAFGDMMVFVLGAGLLSVVPTWFLLKLWLAQAPRTLLAAELLLAAIGPVCWLAVWLLAGSPNVRSAPSGFADLLGPLIAFVAIPRMVFGPVLVIIEGVTLWLTRERLARMLLPLAMLMDVIPVSLFALHMAAAILR